MKVAKTLPESFTLTNILDNFSTEEKARTFSEMWIWTNGPTCPRCESCDPIHVYKMVGKSIRPGLHFCRQCRRSFTATVGTIFEDSHLPLRKSKKGISSLQLQRTLDLGSYRTALFMTHRIRHAMKESGPANLSGVVEIDETYVGGKIRGGMQRAGRPGPDSNKTPVVSLVERDGNKRSVVMPRVTAVNLLAAVDEHVAEGSTVCTDALTLYKRVGAKYTHHAVDHRAKKYARNEPGCVAHSNTVESSFSLLKRGVCGTSDSVSKTHLHLYLAEFDHRWNHRKTSDGERTVAGLKKARGKRLTYKAIKGIISYSPGGNSGFVFGVKTS